MKSKLEQINKLISEMEDEVPEGERLEFYIDNYKQRIGKVGDAPFYERKSTLKAKLVREVEL